MRIAFVSDGISPYVLGGMQRHSFNLVRSLAERGISIDLYHTDKGSGEDIHQLEGIPEWAKSNIHSIRIPWPTTDRFPGHYLRELKVYSAKCLEVFSARPTVDFIYSKGLTGQAFIDRKQQDPASLPPVGLKAHGYEMFQRPPDLKSRLQFQLLKRPFKSYSQKADLVFSYGGKITTILEDKLDIPREKIAEIPGAVGEEWIGAQPEAIPEPKRRFVFLGRFERRKGILELHNVITRHPEWQEQASFSFIGPIPESSQLQLPHVTYYGKISEYKEIVALLKKHEVIITPSHSEGMPNVIMEGMASGLTPIATDVGAVAMLVEKKTGILIPPSDTIKLTEAIQETIDTPSDILLQKRVASHLKITQSFTWDVVAEKNIMAITSFLGNAS